MKKNVGVALLTAFIFSLIAAVVCSATKNTHPQSTVPAQATAPAVAASSTKLKSDSYTGYFVSNKYEPDAAASYAVITDQNQFDQMFGVAMVMNDKSHRLAPDAFKSNIVLAAIKRGKAMWTFQVKEITLSNGVVTLRYTTVAKDSDTATFACPLIVSIPKGDYTVVEFVENGKTVKTIPISLAPAQPPPPPNQLAP